MGPFLEEYSKQMDQGFDGIKRLYLAAAFPKFIPRRLFKTLKIKRHRRIKRQRAGLGGPDVQSL